MFDEFFYRRRKNKGLYFVMIALIILGIGMFAMGFLYLF
ncbi:membrane protein [Brevibacillus reuszeri]|uniref:Membrane protein n=1 Tax=Brevibacillus reuszeri TaxID=54915 RepID=A0A0K9YYK5_9BACL|nr:membrane protein [Brevibacillus reuszeri]